MGCSRNLVGNAEEPAHNEGVQGPRRIPMVGQALPRIALRCRACPPDATMRARDPLKSPKNR